MSRGCNETKPEKKGMTVESSSAWGGWLGDMACGGGGGERNSRAPGPAPDNGYKASFVFPPLSSGRSKASELQVLWGEVFPRMVAEAWVLGRRFPVLPQVQSPPTSPHHLEQHRRSGASAWCCRARQQLDKFAKTQFGHRLNLLKEYLTSTMPRLNSFLYASTASVRSISS